MKRRDRVNKLNAKKASQATDKQVHNYLIYTFVI